MYALTYKKKNVFSKAFALAAKYKLITLILVLGAYQFSGGAYIFIKAEVAQYLIAKAWQKSLSSEQKHKPWPWADTHPIAELIIKEKSWFVLAGASGRNLAFAPSHVSSTAPPGELGNSVIVGHRDTQFNILKALEKGDLIELKTKGKRMQYKVSSLRIAEQTQIEHLEVHHADNIDNSSIQTLTLITCYPFDSILPNPTFRYVVRAVAN